MLYSGIRRDEFNLEFSWIEQDILCKEWEETEGAERGGVLKGSREWCG